MDISDCFEWNTCCILNSAISYPGFVILFLASNHCHICCVTWWLSSFSTHLAVKVKDPEEVKPRKVRRVEVTPPPPLTKAATKKVPVVVEAKAEEAALKRKTPTPHTTPRNHLPLNPTLNDRPGPVGGVGG